MSVFGKLFNYEKPGAGVDKNAPKKTGVALFFSIFKEKFWKLIPLSLLYVLCSLPIVTVGLANIGVTYIARNFAREKPVMLASDFFSTIKKNWKQGLAVGFVNLVLTAILLFAMWFYFKGWNESLMFKAGLVICGCIFVVFTFLKYYINMLIVTFDLSFSQLYKNSLLLSSVGLKENGIITVSLIGLYAVAVGLPVAWGYVFEDMLVPLLFMILDVLFLPAMHALVVQFCVFPVIKKHMIDPYYEAHPEAKKDKSLLNLFDDDEEEGEEAIFKDMGSSEQAVQKSEESSIPKQYSKRDMKEMRRAADDDDTI